MEPEPLIPDDAVPLEPELSVAEPVVPVAPGAEGEPEPLPDMALFIRTWPLESRQCVAALIVESLDMPVWPDVVPLEPDED